MFRCVLGFGGQASYKCWIVAFRRGVVKGGVIARNRSFSRVEDYNVECVAARGGYESRFAFRPLPPKCLKPQIGIQRH